MKSTFTLVSVLLTIPSMAVSAQDYIRVPGDYPTIQEAVDVAAPYDFVVVAPGTYQANGAPFAVIDKPLTLLGGGSEGTYMSVLDGGAYGSGTDNSCPSTTWARAIDIHSSDVTIQGFRIQNFMGAQSGNDWGVAIMARGDCHTPLVTYSNLNIDDVATVDCRQAINFYQVDESLVSAIDCTYVLGVPDDYGITMRHSNQVEVSKCYLDTGIYMAPGCDNARVLNNRIFDSPSHGIWIGAHENATGPNSDSPTVSGNRVTRAGGGGIVIASNPAETVTDALVRGNVVRRTFGGPSDYGGITIIGGTFEGLRVSINDSRQSKASQPGLLIADCTMGYGRIDRNRFAGNAGPGILLHNVSRGAGDLLVIYNSLYSNVGNQIDILLEDASTPMLTATYNWWGDWSGPYHATINPNGSGGSVGDNINFDNWLWIDSYRAPYIRTAGMEAGTTGRVMVKYCTPWSPVQMYFSLNGGGPFVSAMGTMSVTPPFEMLPKVWTDHKGNAQNNFHVPAVLMGLPIWFQAYDFKQERLSNGHSVIVR